MKIKCRRLSSDSENEKTLKLTFKTTVEKDQKKKIGRPPSSSVNNQSQQISK